MIVYPAIDIQQGRCVRLAKGVLSDATVYSENPEEQAKVWKEGGASFIHVVDLDGASRGRPENLDVVEKIAAVGVPVQFGGGVRSRESLNRILEAGVSRVVMGTAAVKDIDAVSSLAEEFGEKLAIGIDSRKGMVSVEGWTEDCDLDDVGFALRLQALGVRRVIFTDIDRDGVLLGSNIEATKEMIDALDIPVIASGGVTSMDDIAAFNSLEKPPEGVIVGRAFYTGDLELREVLDYCSSGGGP